MSTYRIIVIINCIFFLFGCSGRKTTQDTVDSSPDRQPDASLHSPDAHTVQPQPDGALATTSEEREELQPAPDPIDQCQLQGTRGELTGVIDASLLKGSSPPMVVAILARPKSEPLDLEGSEPLPTLRSLYLLTLSDFEAFSTSAEEVSQRTVIHLFDDPGPIMDSFGRRSYERLATVRGTCDGSGCIVATVVERLTPNTEGAAFTTYVQLLDSEGTPQQKLQPLAQEPDRGERLSALCVGISNEGFVIATSVQSGRGRLLWLDRGTIPLDMKYIQGGFSSCSIHPAGLRLEVATQTNSGLLITSMGASEDESGSGPWQPETPKDAQLPVLSVHKDTQILLWSHTSGIHLSSSKQSQPSLIASKQVQHLDLETLAHEKMVIASIDTNNNIGIDVIDHNFQVRAHGEKLGGATIKASHLWLTEDSEKRTYIGWFGDEKFDFQKFTCASELEAKNNFKIVPLVSLQQLNTADKRNISLIRKLARKARNRDRNYRSAWLSERAYHFDPSNPEEMVTAAGLLSEIRYTKSALRILERLDKLNKSSTRSALRTACYNKNFERMWPMTDFQRATGCRAPVKNEPDSSVEEASTDQSDQGESNEPGESQNTTKQTEPIEKTQTSQTSRESEDI